MSEDRTLYEQIEARESADELDVASFNGTLAFSRQALWCVFLANLINLVQSGSGIARFGVLLAIWAVGAAYLSQMLGTLGDEKNGTTWQLVSAAAAVLAALVFISGA